MNQQIFVVRYYHALYGDMDCYRGNSMDYKDFLTMDNPSIEGIFSHEATARQFIHNLVEKQEDVADEEDMKKKRQLIKHLEEHHYTIDIFEIDERLAYQLPGNIV